MISIQSLFGDVDLNKHDYIDGGVSGASKDMLWHGIAWHGSVQIDSVW